MRKTLWIILAVLLGLAAPKAIADSFTYTYVGTDWFAGTTITFQDTAGPAPLGTSFVPIAATDLFVNSTGTTQDLGPIQSVEFFGNGIPSSTILLINTTGTSQYLPIQIFLDFGSLDPGNAGTYSAQGGTIGTNQSFTGGGSLQIQSSTVATPEPGAGALLLVGIGLALALRKLIP
jgi:hypothetical protein